MNWYTLDNGRLCLGTNELQFANFHIATEIKLDSKVSQPLLPEHVELIGSYPEDWYADESIDNKINDTARHLFGSSSEPSKQLFI
jgi:hypothetical protein